MQSPIEFNKPSEISTASVEAPQLSDYMDYRLFLADWYSYKRTLTKNDLRPYAYSMFSAAANIKSPNYLKMIIEGHRNLSEDMIGSFARAMGFNKETTTEFKLMVLCNQAQDPVQRNVHLKALVEHRVQGQLKRGEIDKKTWDKIPNWVTWVLYALVDQSGVDFSVPALKQLLRGKASENEIEASLTTLLESGQLCRDPETGKVSKPRRLIDAPEDIPVALVRKLQSQLMLLGLESLYQDEATEREFGTLTMSMTKAEFEEVKFKLRQMRKAIHKDNSTAREKSQGDRVYQLNIQLFPVTNISPVSRNVYVQNPQVPEDLFVDATENKQK